MEIKNDILLELEQISALIAAIERKNIFNVPNGYFDSIGITVLACLEEQKEISPGTEAFSRAEVPAGYFDNLSFSILDKIKTQNQTAAEELAGLSSILESIQKTNVFKVPGGYFDHLGEHISDKVKMATNAETDIELSPLLTGVQKVNVFKLPASYFDNLSAQILQKLTPTIAKIVFMPRRNIFIRYAAAAVIAGLVMVGIYTQSNHKPHIAAVASAELDPSIEKGLKMNDQQFNAALDNLSEDDIASYLEKNTDIADVTTLSNNIEDNKLPSQEDYLLDEKTLENYLNKLESTSANN